MDIAVVPTALRSHDLYVKMYRSMGEFLIFKATPWISFLILFLSLKVRRDELRTLGRAHFPDFLGAFFFAGSDQNVLFA